MLGWNQVKGLRQTEQEESDAENVEAVKQDTEGRQKKLLHRIAIYKKENDNVYAPDILMEGVYFLGGILIDFKQEDRLEKEFS